MFSLDRPIVAGTLSWLNCVSAGKFPWLSKKSVDFGIGSMLLMTPVRF